MCSVIVPPCDQDNQCNKTQETLEITSHVSQVCVWRGVRKGSDHLGSQDASIIKQVHPGFEGPVGRTLLKKNNVFYKSICPRVHIARTPPSALAVVV